MSSVSTRSSFKCFAVPMIGLLGGTSIVAAVIGNWADVRETIRIAVTFGGIQWMPATIALIAGSIIVGCYCASEPERGEDRDMSAAMVFTLIAAWVVGAVAFLFTIGDIQSITAYQGTAAVVSALCLCFPICTAMLEISLAGR